LRIDTATSKVAVSLIEKKNTSLRECISAAEKLSLTLRHLAIDS